ncbi:sulfurtransferase [Salipaludibacillus keqinensis]|uniref:Sulfurtransferase n=1 Tax=Salipaludibacillus keqinensis TaxID=2045207 RepID=A0A323T577_9BACI|nr:rhodanese-like domain-containing protein [Salipaludibacillus keqinensis]PYZ91672.1 sulfurtransferase [Salipaludibacillus keqinensis]
MGKKLKMISFSSLAVLILGIIVYFSVTGIDAQEVDLSVQQEKINEYANPEVFITAESLHQLMEDDAKDVVVIGTMDERGGAIPGSFEVWRPNYSGTDAYPYGGMANSIEEMEALLGSFGVKEDTTIVTYAANDQHDSARLFWQLEMLGHEDVRLLDGGINVWIGAGYETSDPEEIGIRPETAYEAPDFNEEAFNASLETVKEAVDNERYLILDTRAKDEEEGSTTLSGAEGPGKIKGSTFIEYSEATAEDGTIKPLDELEEIYGDVLSKDQTVISYCQSGVRSAYTWLVLTHAMGHEEALNYDGSWIEWSYGVYQDEDSDMIEKTENHE